MDLFLDKLAALEKEFKKEAGFAARLSENQDTWPQELQSELFKQLPFLSDYEVMVNLDRVDPQRGYAFGWADVSNKTERPEVEHDEMGLPHIRIPLIIVERSVKPFNVFLDGERVLPLTEDRVRETLFNPSAFDLSVSEPRDPDLINPLMPPSRNGMGGIETKTAAVIKEALSPKTLSSYAAKRGVHLGTAKEMIQSRALSRMTEGKAQIHALKTPEGRRLLGRNAKQSLGNLVELGPKGAKDARTKAVNSMSMYKHKTSSSKVPLLEAIAHTISQIDRDTFVEKIASNPTLQAGFKRSGVTGLLIEVMDNTKVASAQDRFEILAENVLPTVVTIQKLPGGDFLVKSANVDAFAGGQDAMGEVVQASEAAQALGDQTAQAMQPGQTATAVTDPVEPQVPGLDNQKVAEEFGEWLVQDMMGNSLLGWVFPYTLAWDGNFTPQPIALFSNGSAYAVQDTIAGQLVGKSTGLPSDAPRGDGVFYYVEGGNAIATAPITIGSAMGGMDGMVRFMGTDLFGNQVRVSQVEGIKAPTRVSDVEYAIPATWKFMRLNNQVELVPDPVQLNKMASAALLDSTATLFFNGTFNLIGECGLDKVASELKEDLDAVSAEFMLGLLGVDGATAKQKVAEARKKGSVKLAGLKTIKTLAEHYEESVKTASAFLSELPDLRRDLVKEAAVLTDESTVDKVLALNFISPENLATFVEYLPELEECSEQLAEMLLTCYLGMKELPEGAIERAMKNLEEVLMGLKALQHAEVK